MKVGFIGLGRMGRVMAGRLLDAGHDLTVYNRTADKAVALGEAGAAVADSLAEAARGRDVVITMLAHDAALREVAFGKPEGGEGGLVRVMDPGSIHLCMGTHSVAVTRALTAAHREAGQILVASPVLGRPEVAAEGQVGIVPAGPKAAVETCRPLFDVLGRRTFEPGEEPEAAASVKVANNFVLGCAIEAMGEAFSLVRRYDVTPDLFYDVMTDGIFSAPAYKVYGDIIAKEDWDRVGITAVLGLKDANLALAAGEAVGVPLPSGNVWRDRLVGAVAHGDGDRDWAVMAREQYRSSGLE